MTSQHKRDQKTQDDTYSNHDEKPHAGPIKSPERQPGPKPEKIVPTQEPEPDTEAGPVPLDPEKKLPQQV